MHGAAAFADLLPQLDPGVALHLAQQQQLPDLAAGDRTFKELGRLHISDTVLITAVSQPPPGANSAMPTQMAASVCCPASYLQRSHVHAPLVAGVREAAARQHLRAGRLGAAVSELVAAGDAEGSAEALAPLLADIAATLTSSEQPSEWSKHADL